MSEFELLKSLNESLAVLSVRITELTQTQQELKQMILNQTIRKEWYSTAEVAEIMNVKQYTVQERWCNQGRIECEKDPDSGKWRIPGHEVERLKNGGQLSSRNRSYLSTSI